MKDGANGNRRAALMPANSGGETLQPRNLWPVGAEGGGLGGARGAAATLNLRPQKAAEALDDIGVRGGDVGRFGGIGGEVVELEGWQGREVGALDLEPLAGAGRGRTPAAGAGPEEEFPAAVAD